MTCRVSDVRACLCFRKQGDWIRSTFSSVRQARGCYRKSMPQRCFSEGLLYRVMGSQAMSLEGPSARMLPFWGADFRASPHAYGIQLHWVEGAACQLFYGDRDVACIEPGGVVAVRRSESHRVLPALDHTSPQVLSGVWPTSPWLEQLLLDSQQVVHLRLTEIKLPLQVEAMRNRVVDNWQHRPLAPGWRHPGPSADVVLDIMLTWLEKPESATPLAKMLSHPRMGEWLYEVLAQEDRLPAVHDAASRCHLSRSAFMLKFAELSGMPYADFMTHWRMNASLGRLVHAGGNVSAESIRWGYASDAAFRKAFARVLGTTPGRARQASSVDSALAGAAAIASESVHAQTAAKRLPGQQGAVRPQLTVKISEFSAPPSLQSLLSNVIASL